MYRDVGSVYEIVRGFVAPTTGGKTGNDAVDEFFSMSYYPCQLFFDQRRSVKSKLFWISVFIATGPHSSVNEIQGFCELSVTTEHLLMLTYDSY